ANVHIRVDGWPNQTFALLFRDWLRADDSITTEYSGIKRRASEAAAGITDFRSAIEAYENAKAPWFDVAYRRAWQWAEETNWTA
ncbi:MAG: GrpB family protein, partial [Rhodococcus sp. (in: high G+C Gram-positive bacteria)]